jgi:hypothetical protein
MGKPMTPALREGRLEPKHLRDIPAKSVVAGMCVGPLPPRAKKDPRLVMHLEHLPLDQIRIVFDDGSAIAAPPQELLSRELTDHEIMRIEKMMAKHIGRGATEAEVAK